MKYRKKPIVIEAIQWNGENFREIDLFMNMDGVGSINDSFELTIKTLEGDMKASLEKLENPLG